MKHDMNSQGGMTFAENPDLPQGTFILQRGPHVILTGSLGEHGSHLAAAYRISDTVQVSTLDYAALAKIPVKPKPERPWNTAMSAPEGVDLECKNGDRELIRMLRNHGGIWYTIFNIFPTYPPTHWRYTEDHE